MRFFRRIVAGAAIAVIPFVVGFPVALLPMADSGAQLTPREALMAQVSAALRTTEESSRTAMGLVPALVAVVILLAGASWFALRQRPRVAPVREPRAKRAAQALELIRRGRSPEEVIVRAHLSREAIELLRHTTMGQPAV